MADLPECPLISVPSFNDIAGVVGATRSADLRLQLDPWLGRTTSDPELRPDSAAAGKAVGIPIVNCDTARPPDGQVSRPAMFAINLTGGVTFGDVIRLYNLEGILIAQPAGIGALRSAPVNTDETAPCRRAVELAQPRPRADAGGTAERGEHVDRWRHAQRVGPDGDRRRWPSSPSRHRCVRPRRSPRDTGVVLLGEPVCADGWAFGTTVECPPPTRRRLRSTRRIRVRQRAAVGDRRHRGLRVARRLPRRVRRVAVRRHGRHHVYGEPRPTGNDGGDGQRGRTSSACDDDDPSLVHRIDSSRSARERESALCRLPSSTSATSCPSMAGSGRSPKRQSSISRFVTASIRSASPARGPCGPGNLTMIDGGRRGGERAAVDDGGVAAVLSVVGWTAARPGDRPGRSMSTRHAPIWPSTSPRTRCCRLGRTCRRTGHRVRWRHRSRWRPPSGDPDRRAAVVLVRGHRLAAAVGCRRSSGGGALRRRAARAPGRPVSVCSPSTSPRSTTPGWTSIGSHGASASDGRRGWSPPSSAVISPECVVLAQLGRPMCTFLWHRDGLVIGLEIAVRRGRGRHRADPPTS